MLRNNKIGKRLSTSHKEAWARPTEKEENYEDGYLNFASNVARVFQLPQIENTLDENACKTIS